MSAKILVIEDDPSLRSVIASTLTRLGYEVRAAGDGREGLELFEAEAADLVITDIYMPDIEGMETIRRLKCAAATPKVIAISAGTEHGFDVLRMATGVGADRAALKPLSISGLVRLAQELLDDADHAAA